jgi:hypothetical protein
MAAGTGHLGHDWLRQAHWPCSVMRLARACLMMDSVSCYLCFLHDVIQLYLYPSVSKVY